MPRNEHGLETTGSAEAIALFDRATDKLAHFDSECTTFAADAILVDPSFVMGHVLHSYLLLLSTETADSQQAGQAIGEFLSAGGGGKANPRERQHLIVVQQWLRGDWTAANGTLLKLQQSYPRDLLALVAGHQLDIFQGNLKRLRDRVGDALSSWQAADRHRAVVMGMYAFGLEECGDYGRARETGQHAVELDPHDAWGLHAVAHTYEMTGEFRDGARYLDERVQNWASEDNFFKPHNWWHYCLYELEAGNKDNALAIFDQELHNEHVEPAAMRMLDASALLWRLYLQGEAEDSRWRGLSSAWQAHVETPHFAFNDMHAMMAFIGAGDFAHAETLIASRRRYILTAPRTVANQAVTATVGLPICEALLAFGQGRYGKTVDLLYPIRDGVYAIGGSDAQRDAVQQTLVEAALRAGREQVARELIDERMISRPCSPYNWLKLANLRRLQGAPIEARDAERRSAEFAAENRGPGRNV